MEVTVKVEILKGYLGEVITPCIYLFFKSQKKIPQERINSGLGNSAVEGGERGERWWLRLGGLEARN